MISSHVQRRAGRIANYLLQQQQRQQRTNIGCLCSSFHTSLPVGGALEDISLAKSKEQPPLKWSTHKLKPEQVEKVDRIFHKILWLDMVETHMLSELLNERWDLKLTPKQNNAIIKMLENEWSEAEGQGGSKSKGVGDGDEEAPEAPKLFELKLAGFDPKSKIKVIKEVRSIAGLGLKEAKEVVESMPKIFLKDLKPEAAEELKAKLEAAGAQVELISS
mmetsp:Transcript_13782/g.17987  ORF Transcript_13782/g.17987 Transcript_13782/m.17987 type:complete len:219 (+) Transcript_13782:149-805(+)|eukprot:CAMPEP_0198143934 /NCGR_PEP_ID=MMETSP1443-20131203/11798_1 /TAXON_ID=186043 /ORGANISM="Entomoneis sp., Strain CCMP2396" /LENGTH=218 /DNA_ID=CAMNT_0043807241 /DNA_START=102 /DNA_END=758 /DNA_ORIENTATION=-